jgi:nitrate/TMAO reductase-like tetraheme cytochrome c subunit
MARWRAFRERFARPLRFAIQAGILVIIVGAVAGVGFIEYSAQPGFCDNCHNMVPYYQSWATSSHNDVPCIKCHYAPGIRAEAMGKLQAANQVVKYITGAYGTKPWAEIEDAACLRSGCHTDRKLEGARSYKGLWFDHARHLGDLRRGKQLRCTSCHSQIVQGEHLTVTESTCFLCHFKDRPVGEPVASCIGCHPSPPRVTSPAGFVVDHPQYVQDLVSCVSCHREVTTGRGAAEEPRCFGCHNEPDRLEQFGNTELVHRVHIAEHNVECTQCHTPIEHRVTSLASNFELDCAGCHRGAHEAQRQLYAGVGGHATVSQPSAMFLASVSCESCHGLSKQVAAHEQVRVAGEASCLSCHGVRYANILPSWKQEMDRRVNLVAPVIVAARAALPGTPAATRRAADSLVGLAEENLRLVRDGGPTHNITFADQLLRSALDLVRQAAGRRGLPLAVPAPSLGPPLGENVCLDCHLGAERRRVPLGDGTFDHEGHAVRAGLSCTRCHTPLEDHGRTTVTAAQCSTCHHRDAGDETCVECHAGGAPGAPIEAAVGLFPHRPHGDAGLTCTTCHLAPTMSAAGAECQTCHEFHHQPEATCGSCHRQGVKARHDRSFAHEQCSQCHGEKVTGVTRWSREVCTVCHSDRVEHNAPVACVECHQVAPLSGPG